MTLKALLTCLVVADPFDSLHMAAELGEHSSQETLIHVGLQLTWEKERSQMSGNKTTPTTDSPRQEELCASHTRQEHITVLAPDPLHGEEGSGHTATFEYLE